MMAVCKWHIYCDNWRINEIERHYLDIWYMRIAEVSLEWLNWFIFLPSLKIEHYKKKTTHKVRKKQVKNAREGVHPDSKILDKKARKTFEKTCHKEDWQNAHLHFFFCWFNIFLYRLQTKVTYSVYVFHYVWVSVCICVYLT